ncbi:MAG TPA: hypothetical protein VKE98_04320 [Gemmataceae bacterium]|nr:hypothetical protein [Gemmataceae bacterium]
MLRYLLGDLAGEGQDQIQTVSDAWAATEELQDWDDSDVTSLLQQLIDLADGARLEDKDLLLWVCL